MRRPLREPAARRLYRALLRCYPRAFRERYGDAMAEDFERLLADARGPAARARLWLRAAVDVMSTGIGQRLGASPGPDHSTTTTTGGGDMLDDLRQDLRYALRSLTRNPGYAVIVVLTLGMGIGATTSMFSLVEGVLLAPLPYGEGDRIVHLRQVQTALDDPDMPFSVQEIEDYRAATRSFDDLVEYHGMTFTLLGHGEPELVQTGVVSARFFDVMGMQPVLGRSFTEEDDRLGAEPVMILSHEYWRDRFGADPGIVGQGFVMNGLVHTVVGVLPQVPQFPHENDVYMPTSQCPTRSSPRFIENRRARMMAVFGVLGEGTSVEAAQRDAEVAAARLAADHPDVYAPEERGYGARVTPVKEDLVAEARPTLLILMGTALLVLLVACANVASLALARAVRRGTEFGVRQALGAGRGRMVRQLLTESILLAVVGGAVGVALAEASLGLLVKFAGQFTQRAFEASVDAPVLAFALGVSLLTGVLFGAVPALRRASEARASLGQARSGVADRRTYRAHRWLVAGQVSLAFVLLIGAGLLVRTFVAVSSVDPGYRSSGVVTAQVTLPMAYFMGGDVSDDELFDEVLRRVEEIPGVRSAARVQAVPLGGNTFRTGLETEANAGSGPDGFVPVMTVRSSPGYLETLDVPVLAGRTLTEQDRELPERSAVLPVELTRQLWPGEEALDRQVRVCSYNSGQCGDWLSVVGVVGDVKMDGLEEEPTPAVYLADNSQAFGGSHLVVRAEGDLNAVGQAVVRIVHDLEPDAPVSRVRPLDAYVDDAVAPRRLTASLMALLAALALVVTLSGVAGVVAFTTSRRTREIGVRLALGAERGEVIRQVVRSGMTPALAGVVLGAVGALALSGSLARLVWGVPTLDAVTFVAAAAAVAAGALLACWIPAARATRVDPVKALRTD